MDKVWQELINRQADPLEQACYGWAELKPDPLEQRLKMAGAAYSFCCRVYLKGSENFTASERRSGLGELHKTELLELLNTGKIKKLF